MNSSQYSNNMTTFGRLPKNVNREENKYYTLYTYYATDIIKIENDNIGRKVTLSTGGYYTKSTRNHMINMLAREGINIDISFAGREYKIRYNNKVYRFDLNDKCEFYL